MQQKHDLFVRTLISRNFSFKNSTVQQRDNSYRWKIHHVIHFHFITQFSRIPKSKFVNLIFMAFFAFWQIYFDEVARLENKIFGKFICVLFFLLWFYVKPILSDFRWKTAILTIYLGFGFWFVVNFTLENVKKMSKNLKFIAAKMAKRAVLILPDSSWLISRKIWMTVKSWSTLDWKQG